MISIYTYILCWMIIGFSVVTFVAKIKKDAPRDIQEFLIITLSWPILLVIWICFRLDSVGEGFKAVSENIDHSYSVFRNWLEK